MRKCSYVLSVANVKYFTVTVQLHNNLPQICLVCAFLQGRSCSTVQHSFNADISKWDVSRVTDMGKMFIDASAFNANISEWDVAQVNKMEQMFQGAKSFNADISNWDVSSVTSMRLMFAHAISFNVDISKWDVSGVRWMQWMFSHARSFNWKLCGSGWVQSTANQQEMFLDSPGSISQTVCENRAPITTMPATTTLASTTTMPSTTTLTPKTTIPSTTTLTPKTTTYYIYHVLSTITWTPKTTMRPIRTCSACGTKKLSRKHSCCAPGGAWFNKCGNPGDSTFEHTWLEGIEACTSKPIAK